MKWQRCVVRETHGALCGLAQGAVPAAGIKAEGGVDLPAGLAHKARRVANPGGDVEGGGLGSRADGSQRVGIG